MVKSSSFPLDKSLCESLLLKCKGLGQKAKMCRGLLETGGDCELVANKEKGSQSNNCKEDNSANSLN